MIFSTFQIYYFPFLLHTIFFFNKMFFYENQKNIYAHGEIATTCIVVAKEDMVKDVISIRAK
jgi:hypothetical protein